LRVEERVAVPDALLERAKGGVEVAERRLHLSEEERRHVLARRTLLQLRQHAPRVRLAARLRVRRAEERQRVALLPADLERGREDPDRLLVRAARQVRDAERPGGKE